LEAKIDEILSIGFPLHSSGINNWALNKAQALLALTEFSKMNVAVLGGDVLELVDGSFQHNYDNWYCDQALGEVNQAYLLRSIQTARNYITDYNNPKTSTVYFALVPQAG